MYVCMRWGWFLGLGVLPPWNPTIMQGTSASPPPPCGVGWVQTDEHENRIQKKLGIEFKEEFNLNLIPMCLFFIWPSSRN